MNPSKPLVLYRVIDMGKSIPEIVRTEKDEDGWTSKELKNANYGSMIDARTNTAFINAELRKTSDYDKFYYWYVQAISQLMNQELRSSEYVEEKRRVLWIELVDAGMLPAYMPPTFFKKEYQEVFRNRLKRLNIPYEEFSPVRIYGGKVLDVAFGRDIYVYRESAAKFLNCSIREAIMKRFVGGVINASN